MKAALTYMKQETVLSVAWILALLSMVLVPPDRTYWNYIDFHTLGLLFSLMAVMAGLQHLGLFRKLGEMMLEHTHTARQLEGVLIFLPFFASMAVTNDVALITFVPFALEVLGMAGEEDRLIPVVTMQTIAANLGSMATPIGNPQNLYLFSHYRLTLGDFFSAILPLTLGAALLLALFLRTEPTHPLSVPHFSSPSVWGRKRLWMYLALFLLCLGGVVKWVSLWLLIPVVVAALLLADRPVLAEVDYSLLLTFLGFFLFVGNLGRLPLFRDLFQTMLTNHETACSILASQVISNVPAALLVGTNLGGLGTLIASMASLISYKQLTRQRPDLRGKYLLWFTGANLVFLAGLLVLYRLMP